MIKVLLVRDYNACNIPYLIYCTYWLKRLSIINFTEVSVQDYVKFDHNFYDIVIYATFPDEHSPQFLKTLPVIPQTDDKFLNFQRIKILFDSHDHGNLDGFRRFLSLDAEIATSIPRIKTAPHRDYLQKYSVVLSTTYPVGVNPHSPSYNYLGNLRISPKKIERNIAISYRVNLGKNKNSYRYQIRKKILDILKYFQSSNLVDNKFKKDPNYKTYLSRVLISICPPGYGPGTFRHLETLNGQTLMLSHNSIDLIKLLPNTDLVEGEDYISFNLENLLEKLDILLADRGKIDWVAQNGYKKFTKGYSVFTSTWKFYQVLRQLVLSQKR